MKDQEQITRLLKGSRAIVSDTSKDELMDEIREVAPIAIASAGPTSLDRSFTSELDVKLPRELTHQNV